MCVCERVDGSVCVLPEDSYGACRSSLKRINHNFPDYNSSERASLPDRCHGDEGSGVKVRSKEEMDAPYYTESSR